MSPSQVLPYVGIIIKLFTKYRHSKQVCECSPDELCVLIIDFFLMQIQQPQLITAKQPPLKRKPNRYIKCFVCFALFIAFAIYRFTFPTPSTACITDAYHQATLAINRKIVEDPGPGFEGNSNQLTTFGRVFIGIGQVLMDLWVFVLGIIWLLKTKNLRGMAAIALFYLIRGIVFLNVMKFPYPQNLAWRSPGFFSITVPYDHTRDFFFSGHCGGLTVIMSEMFALGLLKTGVLALLSLVYMGNMLMTTQVHYSIDIVAGILFALWWFRLAVRYTSFFDRLLSLPYVAFQKIAMKCKGEEGAEVTSEAGGSEAAASDQDEKEKGKVESKEVFQQQQIRQDHLNEQQIEDGDQN